MLVYRGCERGATYSIKAFELSKLPIFHKLEQFTAGSLDIPVVFGEHSLNLYVWTIVGKPGQSKDRYLDPDNYITMIRALIKSCGEIYFCLRVSSLSFLSASCLLFCSCSS